MKRSRSRLPGISIVIAAYNSERTIGTSLRSVRTQQYPQELVEIIIADGGSSDGTRSIAKQFDVYWINVDPNIQNAEINKSIGIQKASKEILFLLDHDNVLPHSRWLREMIRPFQEHREVVGVETLRYHYDPSASLIDRYFALFGAGDPVAWYLGKADRLSYIYDTYKLLGQARDEGPYYIVRFAPDGIPTLGANGFLVRRKILRDHASIEPGKYFHIDVNVDLIRNGFNTYAFVKESIIHLTGYKSVWNYLYRRMLFVEQFHVGGNGILMKQGRRYSVFEHSDTLKLIWFVFISITLIIPFIDSLRGYRKVRDSAWFFHPVLCLSLVYLYGWVIIRHGIQTYAKKLLGH